MSRIGKKSIIIPEGVKISQQEQVLTVVGSKGSLSLKLHSGISTEMTEKEVRVKRESDDKYYRSLHGLTRSLIVNMFEGVTKGFEKVLEIYGVGYRASMEGRTLVLQIGFSHPVKYLLPEGINVEVEKNTILKVTGIDKQLVGEVAAELRSFYPPEPFKGKGIRYRGEYVRRKAGKTAG